MDLLPLFLLFTIRMLYITQRGNDGISSLAKYYAVKLAKNKVKVHLVNPTTTIKSYNEEYFKQNKDLSNKIREKIPMAKNSNENDIAICIEDLSFIRICGLP